MPHIEGCNERNQPELQQTALSARVPGIRYTDSSQNSVAIDGIKLLVLNVLLGHKDPQAPPPPPHQPHTQYASVHQKFNKRQKNRNGFSKSE